MIPQTQVAVYDVSQTVDPCARLTTELCPL